MKNNHASVIKIAAAWLAVLLTLLTVGCSDSGGSSEGEQEASLYDMTRYENDEVFDFQKIQLNSDLAARCESYRFTYLSDGYRIKGYLSVPLSAVRSQKADRCILFNRGGNINVGLLEDDTTALFCAKTDDIIIASQYRGADGSQGTDQFGGDDVHDVIKLIDLCEKHFKFVDMTGFCVAGISRGGMMSYMTARQDKRVKKLVVASGACDLAQLYNERDDMKALLKDCIGCTPEENMAEYEKRSAVCWADEIKVPVLMIHSKQDARVPFSQAERLYGMLKETTDCTFVTHDDNLHNLHKEDYETIVKWIGAHG